MEGKGRGGGTGENAHLLAPLFKHQWSLRGELPLWQMEFSEIFFKSSNTKVLSIISYMPQCPGELLPLCPFLGTERKKSFIFRIKQKQRQTQTKSRLLKNKPLLNNGLAGISMCHFLRKELRREAESRTGVLDRGRRWVESDFPLRLSSATSW